jgi:hypothetical protein
MNEYYPVSKLSAGQRKTEVVKLLSLAIRRLYEKDQISQKSSQRAESSLDFRLQKSMNGQR